MFLTTDQIEALTGRVKPSAQAKCLNRMGIPYRHRADGSLAVSRMAVERVLGGVSGSAAKVASDSDTLEQASALLGHATTEITQRVYRRKPVRVLPLVRK